MLKGTDKHAVAENIRTLKHKGLSEADAVLVSMKRSKKEKNSNSPMVASSSSSEDYPYATRMDLDHDMLEKLGMKGLPKMGSEVKLHARAKIHSVSEHSHSSENGGKPRRSVSLQITHMRVK